MTGEELSVWREARKLTQAQLSAILGMHRDSIARHERGSGAIPTPIEIACAAITLGVKKYDGGEIVLNQYRLDTNNVEGVKIEQLVSLRRGRSKAVRAGVIRDWLGTRGIDLDQDDMFATYDDRLVFEINLNWY